jgi:myo-inositol 2-dehydrogenase/D-chiro-inositol 1-dehydrogenase
VAVVGLGRIGRLHAENLAIRVRSAELVGVVDPVEALARNVAAELDVRWWSSLEELLAGAAVDGVVVATPSELHPELVRSVAAAGTHVFCEKPLGVDAATCAEAVAATRAAGVRLQVGFQRRFDSDWQALKAAVDDGVLGTLDLFRCSHRNARPPEAVAQLGNIFVDVASHDLDAARWLAGEVAEIYAYAGSGDPGAAALALGFQGGGIGLIDVSRRAGYGFECSAELVGSDATMRCGYQERRDGIELLRDGRAGASLARDHAERHREAYVAELEHFGEVALERSAPRVGGEEALAALRLAELAARSAELGVPLAAQGDRVGVP